VPQLFRRGGAASSVEAERDLLRRARERAAFELEAMKGELAERIHAIRERESELEATLAASREVAGAERVGEHRLPGQTTAQQAVDVERRLVELREAERQFLRTQAEMATRSDAIAAREQRVAERERRTSAGDDHKTRGEPEADRPRRGPEVEPSAHASSFSDGLEFLRRQGTRRPTR